MAGVTGLEPAASGVTGRRSNQLSYTPIFRKGAFKKALSKWDLWDTATKQDCQALSKKEILSLNLISIAKDLCHTLVQLEAKAFHAYYFAHSHECAKV